MSWIYLNKYFQETEYAHVPTHEEAEFADAAQAGIDAFINAFLPDGPTTSVKVEIDCSHVTPAPRSKASDQFTPNSASKSSGSAEACKPQDETKPSNAKKH